MIGTDFISAIFLLCSRPFVAVLTVVDAKKGHKPDVQSFIDNNRQTVSFPTPRRRGRQKVMDDTRKYALINRVQISEL